MKFNILKLLFKKLIKMLVKIRIFLLIQQQNLNIYRILILNMFCE